MSVPDKGFFQLPMDANLKPSMPVYIYPCTEEARSLPRVIVSIDKSLLSTNCSNDDRFCIPQVAFDELRRLMDLVEAAMPETQAAKKAAEKAKREAEILAQFEADLAEARKPAKIKASAHRSARPGRSRRAASSNKSS